MKLSRILIASMLLFVLPGFGQDRAVPDHRAAHPPPIAEQATHYSWADVLNVDRVYDTAESEEPPAANEQPQPDCNEGPASPPPQSSEEHADNRVGGTVVGAVIGGLIGHAFGRGDGRKVTTAAGAVAGGVVGNQVAAASDQRQAADAERQADAEREAVAASLRNCRSAGPAPERRIVGYDVEYRYKGEIYMARLAYDPGDRLRVKVSVTPAD
jgi:uncharacterized protein YcfJ